MAIAAAAKELNELREGWLCGKKGRNSTFYNLLLRCGEAFGKVAVRPDS